MTGDPSPRRVGLPSGVVALGVVSLCMDASSELVHSVLPVFLVSTLGASALVVGLWDGLAEGVAQLTKVYAGAFSDRARRRMPLTLAGYGLATLAKPLFALATSPGLVLAARLIDRFGKGLRGAPRDALVADLTPPERLGEAYGLRQSLDTVGAVVGPVLAFVLLGLAGEHLREALWVAVVPAALAVAVLAVFVHEPKAAPRPAPAVAWFRPRLPRVLRPVLVVAALLGMARVSESFLLLRAHEVGVATHLTPLVLAWMNVVYALTAYPAGRLSDRLDPRSLLRLGMFALVAAWLCLGVARGPAPVIVGAAFFGLHMALTQGVLSALVASYAPPDGRGAAFGMLHLTSGLALLPGNALVGWLWGAAFAGPRAAFFVAAALAAVALGAVSLLHRPVR